MPERSSHFPIETSAYRVGYGHLRGIRAIREALNELQLPTHFTDIAAGNSPSAIYLRLQEKLLNIFYRHFPDFFLKFTQNNSLSGLDLMAKIASLLDHGSYNNSLDEIGAKIVITSHMIPARLSNTRPTILLGLDPAPPLYNAPDTFLTTTPDLSTAKELAHLKKRNLLVTGPIVPLEIDDAKKKFPERLKDLQSGSGLNVVIATGGSLSHGQEIINLAASYVKAMRTPDTSSIINHLTVVIGDSDSMKRSLDSLLSPLPSSLKNHINIIYDPDQMTLIEKADQALGLADVIHAKTGELVYVVGGGKVFETFSDHPSLAAQEVALKQYVIDKTTVSDLCALEIGEPQSDSEVAKIISQYRSQILFTRMQNGLRVPTGAARYLASTVASFLKKHS